MNPFLAKLQGFGYDVTRLGERLGAFNPAGNPVPYQMMKGLIAPPEPGRPPETQTPLARALVPDVSKWGGDVKGKAAAFLDILGGAGDLAALPIMPFFFSKFPAEQVGEKTWGPFVHGTSTRLWKANEDPVTRSLSIDAGGGVHAGTPKAAIDRLSMTLDPPEEALREWEKITNTPAQPAWHVKPDAFYSWYLSNPEIVKRFPPSAGKVPRFFMGDVTAERPYNTLNSPMDDWEAQAVLKDNPELDLAFYKNEHEDPGSVSVVMRSPRQFRVTRTFGGAYTRPEVMPSAEPEVKSLLETAKPVYMNPDDRISAHAAISTLRDASADIEDKYISQMVLKDIGAKYNMEPNQIYQRFFSNEPIGGVP